ncbi:3-isopropylmalate dehydrogenase [Staphylococcus schleiferi]|uniref:3-isopropylmalate dehydrogenase n=1 Tax=Staphylococcus schleiferi TaxID=1295 RepID=A0A7Z7VWP9_STASC|nr:3-isopropylmalate dehydrogenase [Staphylococcus schleiferi]SUM87931.1 3-isopropylmalate dehydrogenase [Staphylococcus schleiferi]
MTFNLVALPGDGIGPEIMAGTLEILNELATKFNFNCHVDTYDIGGCAIDRYGTPLPNETLHACQNADAILLGAIGGPKWENPDCRPEHDLLQLRKALNLYANIRPTRVTPYTVDLSPIKREIVNQTDLIIVRELTGGLYFGEPRYFNANEAVDTLAYSEAEITRIAHYCF